MSDGEMTMTKTTTGLDSSNSTVLKATIAAVVTALVTGYFTAQRSAHLEVQSASERVAVLESRVKALEIQTQAREMRVNKVERDIAAIVPLLERQDRTIQRIADRLGVPK